MIIFYSLAVNFPNDTVIGEAGGNRTSTVEEQLLEKALVYLGELSEILKNKFGLR